jgi:hypothetical protein
MISLGVIVFAEVFQGVAQRCFPKQNEMGKTFALDRAHPALREGIRMSLQMRRMATLRTDVFESPTRITRCLSECSNWSPAGRTGVKIGFGFTTERVVWHPFPQLGRTLRPSIRSSSSLQVDLCFG